MSYTTANNFIVKYDQFGELVAPDFYDKSEELLISHFQKTVDRLKQIDKKRYTMLEIGSNQAYYSMMFKAILKDRNTLNLLIEPCDDYIARGIEHFKMNNMEGIFINKSIGEKWIAHDAEFWKETITVDELVTSYGIAEIDVMQCDIDGAEKLMLQTAEMSLQNHVIKNIFLSTHGLELHEFCINELKKYGYTIELDHRVDDVGFDTLIVARV